MNSSTTFQPPPDGWFHIAPHGTFPHPTGALQVIDADACEAMQRTFAEESKQPNFPGLLVDFDHASHDPALPSTAAGWIGALEHRPGGLYAQVRWSDLGHTALTGGRYRLASPVWNRADCDQWTAPAADGRDTPHLRPRRLDRLALTNDPNLPGLMPLSNRKEETGRKKEEVPDSAPSPATSVTPFPMNLRTENLNHLRLATAAAGRSNSCRRRSRWSGRRSKLRWKCISRMELSPGSRAGASHGDRHRPGPAEGHAAPPSVSSRAGVRSC